MFLTGMSLEEAFAKPLLMQHEQIHVWQWYAYQKMTGEWWSY
ncbi:hypothetical protein [Herbidospora galbida]|nr:hypothetical protein [Herbidospora galbida]